ncbi:hypothetical protein D3C71_1219440 [compost metagenome]
MQRRAEQGVVIGDEQGRHVQPRLANRLRLGTGTKVRWRVPPGWLGWSNEHPSLPCSAVRRAGPVAGRHLRRRGRRAPPHRRCSGVRAVAGNPASRQRWTADGGTGNRRPALDYRASFQQPGPAHDRGGPASCDLEQLARHCRPDSRRRLRRCLRQPAGDARPRILGVCAYSRRAPAPPRAGAGARQFRRLATLPGRRCVFRLAWHLWRDRGCRQLGPGPRLRHRLYRQGRRQ